MGVEILVALIAATIPAALGYLASRSNLRQSREAAQRASKDAESARASVEEQERLRRLEERVRDSKSKVYAPMLDAIGSLLLAGTDETKGPGQAAKDHRRLQDATNNFWRDSLIYSSDRSQRAFARFMQGTYHDAPPPLLLRLYAEWIIGARTDLADERTSLSPAEVWAPKLTDVFSNDQHHALRNAPFTEVTKEFDWQPSWAGTVLAHRPEEEPWAET